MCCSSVPVLRTSRSTLDMTHTKLLTIILAAFFLMAVSLALRMSQFYFMSAVLVAVPFVSYLVGRWALKSLACTREAPEFATEGELLNVSLRVKGRSRLLGPIRIEDTLPEWIAHAGPSAGDSMHSGPAVFEIGTAQALPSRNVSPDGIVFSYSAVPMKRGLHQIGPVRVRATDPLGLFDFNISYPLTSRVMTFPSQTRIEELRSATGGEFGDYQFEGGGAKGSGIDFHGVREYQPGDELRRVYWKSTAKHGRLNVIEFEHSLAQDTLIAIDLKQGTEVGRGRFSSLEHCIRIAAGLASDAVTCGSTVRLIGAGIDGSAVTPGRGSDHLYSILHALAQVEADRQDPLSSVLLRSVEEIPRGSSVVCITSAVDGRLVECAELLRSRQARMIVVLVYMLPELHDRVEAQMYELGAAGASVVAVACSSEAPLARVTYQHAA